MSDITPKSPSSLEINIQPGQNIVRPNMPYDQDFDSPLTTAELPEGVVSIYDAPSFSRPTVPDPEYGKVKNTSTAVIEESDPANVFGIPRLANRSHEGGILNEDKKGFSDVVDTINDIDPETQGLITQLEGWKEVIKVGSVALKHTVTPIRPNEGWRMHDAPPNKKSENNKPLARRNLSTTSNTDFSKLAKLRQSPLIK